MTPKVYKVMANGDGFLAIMARPRSGEWLRGELSALRALGVGTVVSLLEPREEMELELITERQISEELGFRFISFPIPDRGVPPGWAEFHALAEDVADDIRGGRGVVIHCRAGIGRSGITAAAVLVSLGHDPGSVFATLTRARGLSVPDTEGQAEWFLRNFRAKHEAVR